MKGINCPVHAKNDPTALFRRLKVFYRLALSHLRGDCIAVTSRKIKEPITLTMLKGGRTRKKISSRYENIRKGLFCIKRPTHNFEASYCHARP